MITRCFSLSVLLILIAPPTSAQENIADNTVAQDVSGTASQAIRLQGARDNLEVWLSRRAHEVVDRFAESYDFTTLMTDILNEPRALYFTASGSENSAYSVGGITYECEDSGLMTGLFGGINMMSPEEQAAACDFSFWIYDMPGFEDAVAPYIGKDMDYLAMETYLAAKGVTPRAKMGIGSVDWTGYVDIAPDIRAKALRFRRYSGKTCPSIEAKLLALEGNSVGTFDFNHTGLDTPVYVEPLGDISYSLILRSRIKGELVELHYKGYGGTAAKTGSALMLLAKACEPVETRMGAF